MAKEPESTTEQHQPKPPHPFLNEVEMWFQETRQDLAHLDTETHNRLYAAKERLKAKIAAYFA